MTDAEAREFQERLRQVSEETLRTIHEADAAVDAAVEERMAKRLLAYEQQRAAINLRCIFLAVLFLLAAMVFLCGWFGGMWLATIL